MSWRAKSAEAMVSVVLSIAAVLVLVVAIRIGKTCDLEELCNGYSSPLSMAS